MSISVLAPAAVIAVDVGKTTAMLSVTDASRRRLLEPVDFLMTGPGLRQVQAQVRTALPDGVVRVGVEALPTAPCRIRPSLRNARARPKLSSTDRAKS
jgi:hypothetical protein